MKPRTILILAGIVLLIFVLGNPGEDDFMGFLGEREFVNTHRVHNYIICSVYDVDGEKYFGITGNFYPMK